MAEQIVVIVVAVLGTILLIYGFISFNKGEIQVYLGRRNKQLVTITGTASFILSLIAVLGGLSSLVMAIAFWLGIVSFPTVFIVAAFTLVLYQMAAFLANLFQ